GNANPSGAVKQDRPRRAVPVGAWIPLVLLLLISAGVLTWLLIPGNRLFQERVASAVSPEEAVQLAEDVNRALEERIVALQAALDGAVCRSDGTLLMPDGVTIEGLLPPDDLDPADGPGSVREARTPSILPPAAERVRVGSEGGFPDTATLLAHIEERTALVLVQGQRGLGNGTGFFVGSDLLVTNYHVIDGADADGIYVSNEAIGSLRPAELVKALGPMDATGGDFALLRVPGVSQPSFEVLATDSTLRLQSVIAAGYPGDLLVSDEAFQQLRAGDLSAVPGLAVTDGTITAEQRFNSATEVLVHSAPISKGNSGGPLIDYCGRMIGVNTFVVKGPMRTLNFALSGRDLARFLEGTPATPRVVSAACNPQIERPSPPIAEASVADDVPLQPLNLGGQDQ
ncbi:MAG: serine protease, partial [Pseudomonadota bacterium]